MINGCQRQMLYRIQKLEFTTLDLNLFLDTNPNNQQALAMFNKVQMELKDAIGDYERIYGPLLNFGISPALQNCWKWVEEPWPWEIRY